MDSGNAEEVAPAPLGIDGEKLQYIRIDYDIVASKMEGLEGDRIHSDMHGIKGVREIERELVLFGPLEGRMAFACRRHANCPAEKTIGEGQYVRLYGDVGTD